VTPERRDLAGFARAVAALEPYALDLVFVGGWAHFLYTLRPEATALSFTPLTTRDADVAAPLRLKARGETLAERLVGAGFELRLKGEHVPPVSEYVLGDDESGFYLEFLAPLEGGEVKRGGRRDATAHVGGATAQKLRYLDLLLVDPWSVTVSRKLGFPLARPTSIQIANPAAYIVQKVLVLGRRSPEKQPKDLLYVHDTFLIFAEAFTELGNAWEKLKATMHPNHVRTFEKLARGHVAKVTDLTRSAARIGADRARAPTPELLLAGLRRGFAEAFNLRVGDGK
jgi:hypothetical protein